MFSLIILTFMRCIGNPNPTQTQTHFMYSYLTLSHTLILTHVHRQVPTPG